ncbi:MAG TPA: hypothetical protein VG245_02505 [Candidatus Dormibacteraeota bacterium]|jgi:hypothetical protein|nr:hypothetical protein [Candidatus Dormibacteraeota bacterium]
MRINQTPLRLNRETVREIGTELDGAAGGAQLTAAFCQRLTIPPTLCGCTGTETATNVCCLQ